MLVQDEEIRRLEETNASCRREAAALREELERQRDSVKALQQVPHRPRPPPQPPREASPGPPVLQSLPARPSGHQASPTHRPPVLGLPCSHTVSLEVASAPWPRGSVPSGVVPTSGWIRFS